MLDPFTLAVTATLITFLGAGWVLWSWSIDRQTPGALWWGIGYLVGGLGMIGQGLRNIGPDWVVIVISNCLIFTSLACITSGARLFAGRPAAVLRHQIPSLIWLIACCFDPFYDNLAVRVFLASVLTGWFDLAIAYHFWTNPERLPPQRLVAVVASLHAGFMVIRAGATIFYLPAGQGFLSQWVAISAFSGICYVFSSAFLLAIMGKSQLAARHQEAAEQDYLTTVHNRRGFFARAAAALATARDRRVSSAVVVFDIDFFKQINDRFGHATGDEVLKQLGQAINGASRKSDIVGRLGGDEFAAFLRDADRLTAERIAARIAGNFQSACIALLPGVGAAGLMVDVSIGIAVSPDSSLTLDNLIDQADRQLYRVKEQRRA